MSMLAQMILALAANQPGEARPQRPPPPPAAEHAYRPASLTTELTYACTDGPRSVTVQYDGEGRARVTSMFRNGKPVRKNVLDAVNGHLKRFDFISRIHHECHSSQDSLIVSGFEGRTAASVWIAWSLSVADTAAASFQPESGIAKPGGRR